MKSSSPMSSVMNADIVQLSTLPIPLQLLLHILCVDKAAVWIRELPVDGPALSRVCALNWAAGNYHSLPKLVNQRDVTEVGQTQEGVVDTKHCGPTIDEQCAWL